MVYLRSIPQWADNKSLVCGFTTRAFGSLSARSNFAEIVDGRYLSLAQNIQAEPSSIFTLPQTHSTNVAILRNRDFLDRRAGRRSMRADDPDVHPGGVAINQTDFDMEWQRGIDGVILAVQGLFAVVLTADCAPVMFWDPVTRVCGLAHVGLVGAINQLPVRMVTLMQEELGVRAGDLQVAILPSIRSCHYNIARSGVWQRLRTSIIATYGPDNPHYKNGYFDLPGFIGWQLENTGVQPSRTFDLGICTVCDSNDFFSHVHAGSTGTQEKEGRFGSIIGVWPDGR